MTNALATDIAWLDARLDEVETGRARQIVDQLRRDTAAMQAGRGGIPTLASLDLDDIHAALKLLTIRFHLRNKAEQVHIARINRQREMSATTDSPRPESIAEAIATLASNQVPLTRLLEIIKSLDIQPTLTAHPTESRRRSVMQKQARIGDQLAIVNTADTSESQRDRAASNVRQTLGLLLATDEVRARRLDVIDEVRNGIHYLSGAIWDAIPGLYHDLADAIFSHYGERPRLPVFLRYRSWIGGDRDGNPNVTAELTRRAFAEMRAAAISRHAEALERLRRDLSISDQRVPIDPALLESIERDEEAIPLDPHHARHLRHEPFRVKIRHMQVRLGTSEYTADRLIEDLTVLQNAAQFAGLDDVAQRGPLAEMILCARTFGFHLAALDVRQHSRVHEAAVAEMLAAAGVMPNYAELDEHARLEVLRDELQSARPLLARGLSVSAATRELLDSLEVFAEMLRIEPSSVGSYIISMTHEVSDVLEVLVLLREVGIWTIDGGTVRCSMDVAPLFETVDDLSRGDDVMRALFDDPAYSGQLEARCRMQEIMLGYSDSNKDGGYWAANWRLHCAQEQLARVCIDAGVSFRFFHGRGGTVARGGGRAHRAILASPRCSRNGRIRFTEQGEVISFRYAMPAIAHRHLEQIANASIIAVADQSTSAGEDSAFDGLMNALAEESRFAYRALIDDNDFWPWFVERSPVMHIGDLPIASRPVSRTGGEFAFENLRAIPWVFAWTQMRYNAPGWYGIGAAFDACVIGDDAALNRCRQQYMAGGFFRAFIDNAQQEMARARLEVAQWYAGASEFEIHTQLANEFEAAQRAIIAITGQQSLLDNNPVIQQSIRERNSDTDVINALQVELLRRWRADDSPDPQLRSVIYLSVNALASAMQSTG